MRARVLLAAILITTVGAASCGDDSERRDDPDGVDSGTAGSGDKDAGWYIGEAGVCVLAKCNVPPIGVACCTPLAQCGVDLLGFGMSCIADPNQPRPDQVCVLADCPEPAVGIPCCTGNGRCGSDPFGTGLMCYPNPKFPDAGTNACDIEECAFPAIGYRCCTLDGRCGTDLYGNGLCAPTPTFPPLPDAGPISTEPPDDPSITGECPSFLGLLGPVWGCCSKYGVCGTFQYDECLLPPGTVLPPPPPDEDGGLDNRCTPP